ncbi:MULTISPECIES: GerAB/ArcD/ProY family transporter [unclassified Paenibacillus]|uniref:GerAB/ArcD/ProY family transporter n=1 Tax=unclassified Paenibacillus TaxID=185978 RepID=UPI0009548DBC|nr:MULTISPECIES: GerAB/ArcD/ProY family transporter [unclassified Paenibacillus]ASS65891.1 GerAB/ArcD/ProY family transporter [Paenibacillus sp. RUD330]SIQ19901.1 Spore germination protein [Paenibacillus sp. RU4X]SIQ41543.1 Spore germination protein [Paenibacillus sp. RU4T]
MNKFQSIILFFLLHMASIFAIFPERMMAAAPKAQWMPVAILFLAELLAVWLYLRAMSKFPGKSIPELCRDAVGKWGAGLMLFPLLVFLFLEIILLTYYLSIEIRTVLLPKTPISATSAVFVAICMYGAWKGLSVMIRASMGWLVLFVPFILFSMLISIGNFNFDYIFPIWDAKFSFIGNPDFYVGTIMFAGFLFLGMTPSHLRIGFGTASALIGFIFLFALTSVYIPLLIFGRETAVHFQYPMLMASDTVDLEWVVFDWLPSFYVVSSSGLGLIKVSVLLWMLLTILKQLYLPRIKSHWLLILFGIVLYLACQWIPNAKTLDKYLYINSYLCLYSTVGFPILVYLSTLRRRREAHA